MREYTENELRYRYEQWKDGEVVSDIEEAFEAEEEVEVNLGHLGEDEADEFGIDEKEEEVTIDYDEFLENTGLDDTEDSKEKFNAWLNGERESISEDEIRERISFGEWLQRQGYMIYGETVDGEDTYVKLSD